MYALEVNSLLQRYVVICFFVEWSSNIFLKKLTIPIAHIQVMEKKRTAMFNDAITIKTAIKTVCFFKLNYVN